MDKVTTDLLSPKNQDLLDRIMQKEREVDRLRQSKYRAHLRKEMEFHSQQKEHEKLEIHAELQSVYENIKKLEDLERNKRQQRLKLEQDFREANRELLVQRHHKIDTEPEPKGKSIYDQLNEDQQQLQQKRRQKLELQNEMNSMQQQIKREDQLRLRSEQLVEEQRHIQQMNQFIQKREQDKQIQRMKHQQNMKAYEEMGRLQKQEHKKATDILNKIENSHDTEAREQSSKHQEEEARREKEIAWRNGVKSQIDQKKRQQQITLEEKRRDRELMDSLAVPPQHYKDTQYLRELQVQIQEQKQKRINQKNERSKSPKEQATYFSPALLGKVPASYQRYRQLEYIDKKMGLIKPVNPIVAASQKSTLQKSMNFQPTQTNQNAREFREYNQLKDKLQSSREYNNGLASRGSNSPQRNSIPVTNREFLTQTKTQSQAGEQIRQRSNSPPASLTNSQVAYKSLRTYDLITGKNRVYNVALPQ